MERMNEKMIAYFEVLRDRAETGEERAKWQRHIDELTAEPKVEEELKAKQYHVRPRIARRSMQRLPRQSARELRL